ncbi:MAG: peptidylprolyl isomerase [Anaerolineae bacterium]|nr:peptidylprolyl isomerase [Anaerolineae bacterium]
MSKRSQTTGLPKENAKKTLTTENPAAEGATKDAPKLKHEFHSRHEREAEIQRWVVLGTGIAVAVVVVILAIAFIIDQVITPNQVVASVEGRNITVSEFQRRVRFERFIRNNQLINIYNTYQSFGLPQDQIGQQLQSQEPYATWLRELQVPDQMGLTVINQMVEDQLIRNVAAERGISVTQDQIDKTIEEFFGFDAEAVLNAEATAEATAEGTAEPTATPTITPTPYVSPTPSPAPTETPIPSATPTPELTPTATLTPFPTIPPTATLTGPEQVDQFQQNRDDFFASIRQQTGLSDSDIKAYFELQALRDAVQESVTSEVGTQGIFADARHILVDTEEEAKDIIDALNAGESFAALAQAVSKDTSSGQNGGELGWSPITQYVAEFQAAVRDAEIGAIVGPVQTEFGYHIIQVRAREERELTEAQIDSAKTNTFNTWLETLKEEKQALIEQSSIWANYVPSDPPSVFG